MEEPLNRLIKELRDPLTRMIVIKGIRRVGKSSLMRVALSELDLPYLLIDLRAGGPFYPDDIYPYLAEELSRLMAKHKAISRILSKVRGVEIAGIKLSLTERRLSVIGKLLNELGAWASSEGRQVVLAFDEAQDLRMIRGFDRLLAHMYDYQEGIKILLAGSEVGLLDRLLGRKDPDAPLFGRAFAEIEIGKLSENKAKDFLKKGFRQAKVRIREGDIEEAVDKLDGIIGWLSYYGFYRIRMDQRRSIERTLEEGSRLAANEMNYFLATRQSARKRYVEVLKILVRPSRWSEVKTGLRVYLGLNISDKQVSNYLNELLEYGFIDKKDGLYCIEDPLLAEAVRRGYIR